MCIFHQPPEGQKHFPPAFFCSFPCAAYNPVLGRTCILWFRQRMGPPPSPCRSSLTCWTGTCPARRCWKRPGPSVGVRGFWLFPPHSEAFYGPPPPRPIDVAKRDRTIQLAPSSKDKNWDIFYVFINFHFILFCCILFICLLCTLFALYVDLFICLCLGPSCRRPSSTPSPEPGRG